MESFDWRDGERTIHFGCGRAAEAVGLLGGPGYVLLTTERAQSSLPAVAEAAATVKLVAPGRVDEVAGELLGLDADRFVALGGGRVIDVAKALTAARRREDPSARTLAVPTTLSGAEMTWVHRHAAGVPADTARARPAVVVCDPALAASQPDAELAGSALNALGHAAEAPVTTQANPVATLAALEAARLIAEAYAGDPEAPDRDALALGALLAGYAIDSTWYGLHHVLSQTLVRLAGVAHGAANAIMLQHTVDALATRETHGGTRLAEALGGDAAGFVRAVCARTGATRLRELGVDAEQLDACADAAAERAELELTPPRATLDELRALYEAAR